MAGLMVATAGTGSFARLRHAAWTRIPGVYLLAVCDAGEARSTTYRGRFGYSGRELPIDRQRRDLLDIAVPPAGHCGLGALAAQHKGQARETGIHCVDIFRYIFGLYQNVYAHLRRRNPAVAGDDSGTRMAV